MSEVVTNLIYKGVPEVTPKHPQGITNSAPPAEASHKPVEVKATKPTMIPKHQVINQDEIFTF